MKNRFGTVRENGLIYVLEHFVEAFKWPLIVFCGALLLYAPNFAFMTPASMRVSVMIVLYAMLGMGLNVLVGYTGQVSLGHAGFYGIGAYTCALLTTKLGWSFWPSLLAAGVLAALVGLLLGLPTLRLSGTYLSIVTLGFCEIVQMILKQWESVTNGNYGIRNIPKPVLFGLKLDMKNGGIYYLALAMCVLTGLFSLIVLLTLISFNVADSAAGGVLVTIMVLLIVLAAMLVILAKFYRYTAKTAKQLKNDTYDGSKKPETWAFVNAAVSLAMLLLRLILVFIPLMRLGNAIDHSSSTLSGYLTEALVNSGSTNLLSSSIPGMALSLCQCASFYCVYLLLKTVRLNMPVTKK